MRRRPLTALALTLAAVLVAGMSPAGARPAPRLPSWRLVDPGVTSHFRGLAAVSRTVAWLGGYTGTVLRTVDGGRTWSNVSPPGAETLQFRDISASDADHAVAMAAGEGTDSRLYSTAATAGAPGAWPTRTPTRRRSSTACPSTTAATVWC